MAGERDTDRVRKLQTDLVAVSERVANLQKQVDDNKALVEAVRSAHQDADKRLDIALRDCERMEKRFDELVARRWELGKIVIAAFLGGILTLAAGVAGEWAKRWLGPGSTGRVASSPPPRP